MKPMLHLVLYTMVTVANALAEPVNLAQVMPEGFEKTFIGLPWEDYIALRPLSSHFSLGFDNLDHKGALDPNKPLESLTERLKSDMFDVVMAFFGTNHCLAAISFVAIDRKERDGITKQSTEDGQINAVPVEVVAKERMTQISKVLETLGSPGKIHIVEHPGRKVSRRTIELIWTTNPGSIRISFDAFEISNGMFFIQIVEASFASAIGRLSSSADRRDATQEESKQILSKFKKRD